AKAPGAARAHIKRRAAALGLESKIPDTWKTENGEPTTVALAELLGKGLVTTGEARVMLGDAFKAGSGDYGDDGGKPCPTCKGDGKIMGDKRTCPDCNGSGKFTAGNKDAEPATVKGSKDCAGCGKSYDADTNMTNCEGCGNKLPPADKAAQLADAVKGSR